MPRRPPKTPDPDFYVRIAVNLHHDRPMIWKAFAAGDSIVMPTLELARQWLAEQRHEDGHAC